MVNANYDQLVLRRDNLRCRPVDSLIEQENISPLAPNSGLFFSPLLELLLFPDITVTSC